MINNDAANEPILVVVPRRQYAEFMRFKEALNDVHEVAEPPSRSPFQNDAEVAKFLAKNLGKVPMKILLEACATKFGKRRTPSQQAAYRYWRKLREAKLLLSVVSDP